MAENRNPCTCVGPTLRFTAGECFTCGRLLASEIGRLETSPRGNGASAGLGLLLHAVGRKRDAMEKRRVRERELRALESRPPRPRPSENARRVVIEPPPQIKSEKRKPRSRALRAVEFATRTF
jgi:hypothetical protein